MSFPKQERAGANGSLLVVNMRGIVNTRTPVRKTLEQLSIAHRFNATIVPDNEAYVGMLNSAKEHVAWCKLDASTASKLLKARSEKSTGRRFKESELQGNGFQSFDDAARAFETGSASLKNVEGMRPFFRLSPPKGGFKRSTRRQFNQGGVLGLNEELPKLLDKML